MPFAVGVEAGCEGGGGTVGVGVGQAAVRELLQVTHVRELRALDLRIAECVLDHLDLRREARASLKRIVPAEPKK